MSLGLEKHFDVKRLARIGPPEYGGETDHGQHLGCTIRWTVDGFTWEGNEKHVRVFMQLMKFDKNTKGFRHTSMQRDM